MSASLKTYLSRSLQKADKRVLWVLALGASSLVAELSLRGWEAHQKVERELTSVRAKIEVLMSSADRVDWAKRSAALVEAHESLQSRLWHAPSEAQAQAMLRDWLSSSLKSADLKRLTISLQTVQPAATPASAPSGAGETDGAEGTGQRLARQAVRVRAALSFELAPNALEAVLQRVERSGQLANVDNINVSRRSRKVDMTVSVPVIIGDQTPHSSKVPT